MYINFFGHNCFILQGKNINIITDPWFTKKGAFYGSWFQWPINHEYKNNFLEKLKISKTNHLYISHEHQDHFDKETLRDIQPYINECFLPKYEDPTLYNEIIKLGYKITLLKDHTKHYLNKSDYIELMITDTGVNHDSAAIIKVDNEIFFNQNDCKIYDRLFYLKDLKVKYYAAQFSGATAYPACFKLDKDEKSLISRKKSLSKLIAIRDAFKKINPKYFIPSAGPAIFPFLESSLSSGVNNIFIHQPDIKKKLTNLNAEIVYLRPGEQFFPGKTTKEILPPTLSELMDIKKNLNCEYDNISNEEVKKKNLINEIQNRFDQIEDIKFSDCPKLIFDWQDEGIEIDIKNKRLKEIDFASYKMPEKFIKISASKKYFNLMSDPNHRWQDIYLSFRYTIQREPDIFNTFVNIFLFSDTNNIRAGFTTTLDINEERILIANPNNGKNYEIDRYCPHNGADLKYAQVDINGNLICPRHAWLFNLSDHGLCKKTGLSISAKEIIDNVSLCDNASVRLLKYEE